MQDKPKEDQNFRLHDNENSDPEIKQRVKNFLQQMCRRINEAKSHVKVC